MKVLAITSSYPRYEGDATAPFVESIVRGVAELGHDVHVLVPEHHEWRRPESEGRVHFHRYRYSPVPSWTPWGFSESLEGGVRIRKSLYPLAPAVVAAAARAARSLLAKGGFDVVHAHWVIPNGPIGRLAVRGKLPLVVSLHGSDIAVSERSRAIARATRWTFERSAAVTAPSRDLLERARGLGARGLLDCVPYGADVEALTAPSGAAATMRARLGLDADDIVVAGIGRLIPVKGFEYLIEAHARGVGDIPRLRLLLVGDGTLREQLGRRARELGVADSVIFAGMAARDEIPAYLAAADVVVVPSIRHEGYVDGLPNVALEAMAAGRPLVASRVGGLPDLVRAGETGVLVEEKDSVGLAAAIVELARDGELRHRLGVAGRAEIRAHRSWKVVAERFVDVYEGAIAVS
ncbi:MAG TPA: glycosyltransferase [Gaiellaceae bacterium]|nr:glycosyltransferase [Gaiellaceae bacterium]